MIVNGKVYKKDLIVFPDHIEANWWRQSGHHLVESDLSSIITAQPDRLFIGAGKYGMMKVSDDMSAYLKSKGISQVYIAKTDDAVRAFNQADLENKVGAFHLTC